MAIQVKVINISDNNFCYGCGAPVKGLHKCQYCGNNV